MSITPKSVTSKTLTKQSTCALNCTSLFEISEFSCISLIKLEFKVVLEKSLAGADREEIISALTPSCQNTQSPFMMGASSDLRLAAVKAAVCCAQIKGNANEHRSGLHHAEAVCSGESTQIIYLIKSFNTLMWKRSLIKVHEYCWENVSIHLLLLLWSLSWNKVWTVLPVRLFVRAHTADPCVSTMLLFRSSWYVFTCSNVA